MVYIMIKLVAKYIVTWALAILNQDQLTFIADNEIN